MQNINRKNKMIEIYSLILIDLVVVFLSYTLALFIRNIARPYDYDTQIHYMGYLYLALFCVLYSVLVEGNRGFFTGILRGICSGIQIYNIHPGSMADGFICK